MNRNGAKFWLLWPVSVIAAILLAGVLLYSDVAAEHSTSAAVKLFLLLFAATAASAAGVVHFERIRRTEIGKIAAFIDSLPSAGSGALESDLGAVWEPLPRSLHQLSARVRGIVDQATLEGSRRQAILTCMAEGVLAVDGQMRVILCNQAFADAFAARSPVPEGRPLYEVVREPALHDILQTAVQRGEGATQQLQLPTAASRWFEARALPLTSPQPHGAVVVLHDITDLRHQEQIRKDFVADVSHELRTPLTAIRGYAETLLEGALDDRENNRRFVEIILSHAIRLNHIASDLLVLSEIDSRPADAQPAEMVPVLDVINSAAQSIRNAAAGRDITLDTDSCAKCFILGQRFRLEQVISNLLENAVKFNRPGGNIVIECSQPDNVHVRISVSDTGIGIPQSDLKRIFERFYRVDKSRSRAAGGTGLGLPIVKEVVERMGGSVAVESQLGKGSKFTILLKRAQ